MPEFMVDRALILRKFAEILDRHPAGSSRHDSDFRPIRDDSIRQDLAPRSGRTAVSPLSWWSYVPPEVPERDPYFGRRCPRTRRGTRRATVRSGIQRHPDSAGPDL